MVLTMVRGAGDMLYIMLLVMGVPDTKHGPKHNSNHGSRYAPFARACIQACSGTPRVSPHNCVCPARVPTQLCITHACPHTIVYNPRPPPHNCVCPARVLTQLCITRACPRTIVYNLRAPPHNRVCPALGPTKNVCNYSPVTLNAHF